jgi:FkbM family methyltransferase
MALGLWEPYVRRAIKSQLKSSSVFIDVGAHIGCYTVLASKIVGENGLVMAIEPDDRNLTLLDKNVNTLKNVMVYKAAAAANCGTLQIELQSNPLFNEPVEASVPLNSNIKDIESITLDSLLPVLSKRQSTSVLIKIDVEGGEVGVLQGALELLKNSHPTLIIEVAHPHEVHETLKPFRYSSTKLFGCYRIFS